MGEGLFSGGRRALLSGNVDLINDSIAALIVDLDQYSPDLASDLSLADIPEPARIAKILLTGKAFDDVEVGGDPGVVFRADDLVYNSLSVDAGVEVGGVVLLKNAATYSESTLLLFTDNSPDLPATPDGTDFIVRWDSGDNGVFRWLSKYI